LIPFTRSIDNEGFVNLAAKKKSLKRATSKSRFLFLALAAGLIAGKEATAQFTNAGFEIGTPGVSPGSPWILTTYLNPDGGVTLQTPQTEEGLNLVEGGFDLTYFLSSLASPPCGPDSQPDPNLGWDASLRWPRYGNQCVLINQDGNQCNANSLSQTTIVVPGMINPMDGQVHVTFVMAPVLENPHHMPWQQPYYFIQLSDDTQNTILYEDCGALDDPNIPWQTMYANASEYDFTDWQLMDVAPGGANIAMGDQLTLMVIASGCALGGHMGELYLDGIDGATNSIPGIFMEGAAPSATMAGGNLTYTLVYRNGSAAAEDGVVLCFNTPANTTFQSLNAPGLEAAAPEAGMPGTVLCTLSNLDAGASGSFTVTVNVNSDATNLDINPDATNTIMARDYYIYSNVETPLLGPKISTSLVNLNPIFLSSPTLCNEGGFSFCFTNVPGASFTVLGTTDVSLPLCQWTALGCVVENPAGTYTFWDQATNRECFYSVCSP
jgi:hypothetical protein